MMLLTPFQLATPPVFQVSHIPTGNLVTIFQIDYFSEILSIFSSGCVFFLALSAGGHAGGSRVYHGVSVGPGRAPWRLLCAFEVAKSGK